MKKMQWFSLLKTLAPIVVNAVAPKLTPVTGKIVGAMEEAEALGGSGPEKLSHVKSLVSDAADVINAAKGHESINKAALNASVEHAVNTAIAVTNLVHGSTPTPDTEVK